MVSVREILDFTDDDFRQLAFKYNVTEFCTSLRPFIFQKLLAREYIRVTYLDPDLFFFSRFEELYVQEDPKILLTPHMLELDELNTSPGFEVSFLRFGAYNGGFLSLPNSPEGHSVSNWFAKRLLNMAFVDKRDGYYTDQKWLDLLPSLVPEGKIRVVRDRGCNVAPWNVHEREIRKEGGRYLVCRRSHHSTSSPLVFAHFSGLKYQRVVTGDYSTDYFGSGRFPDWDTLVEEFRQSLISYEMVSYLPLVYRFSCYDNGQPILHIHRRLFRSMLELGIQYRDPFSVAKDSLYEVFMRQGIRSKTSGDPVNVNFKILTGVSWKIRALERLFLIVFKLLGFHNYDYFLRFLYSFSRSESQLFLLGRSLRRHPGYAARSPFRQFGVGE